MKYITTQEVNATPMNRGEYNILRNWKLPENECARDDGFLIDHIGWPPNPDGYEHYISWVPKELFVKTHRWFDTFFV